MLTPPSNAKMTVAPVARPLPTLARGGADPGASDFDSPVQFSAVPPSIGRRNSARLSREASPGRLAGGLVVALLVAAAGGGFYFRDALKTRLFAQASPTTQPAPAAVPESAPAAKSPAAAGNPGATGKPAPAI